MKKLKVFLLDMPFSLPECPAFGLTQIKTHIDKIYGSQVETKILYLNHRFFCELGSAFFQAVNMDFYNFYKYETNKFMWVDDLKKSGLEVVYFSGGLGDWFFRKIAFPNVQEEDDKFLGTLALKPELKVFILEKREQLDGYLNSLIDEYEIHTADVIGFTSRFQQQVASIAMARKLKELNSRITILMGGPNCEPPAGLELAKNIENIDYILSGRRFLIGFEKLIGCIMENRKDEIAKIPGAFETLGHVGGTLKHCEGRDAYEMSEEDDINDLIELDYDSYFQSLNDNGLTDVVQPVLFFETSRGCVWGEKKRCGFCAIDGYNPKHRAMDSAHAIAYLNHIFQYADRCKYFIGTDSCFPKEYLKEVFPYVKVPEHVHILYETRVDYTEEEMHCLSKNNIDLLIVGIESLSTPALKLLNKGTTAFDNIRFLKYARKFSLNINWNILVGIPRETVGMIRANCMTAPLLSHLYPPTGAWLVSYQGNCDYVVNPDDYGIELEPLIQSYQHVYPFQTDSLEKMTYFQDVKNKKDVFTPMKAKEIQRLSKIVNQWKDRWRKDHESELPRLVLTRNKNGCSILDTRFDHEEYAVSRLEYNMLKALETEKSKDQLIHCLPGYSEANIEKALEYLMERKILFRENDQYLSLVMIQDND